MISTPVVWANVDNLGTPIAECQSEDLSRRPENTAVKVSQPPGWASKASCWTERTSSIARGARPIGSKWRSRRRRRWSARRRRIGFSMLLGP